MNESLLRAEGRAKRKAGQNEEDRSVPYRYRTEKLVTRLFQYAPELLVFALDDVIVLEHDRS